MVVMLSEMGIFKTLSFSSYIYIYIYIYSNSKSSWNSLV